MPKFGAHAFIWAGDWSDEGAEKVIAGAAEAGLDFVEVCVLAPGKFQYSSHQSTARVLQHWLRPARLGCPKTRICQPILKKPESFSRMPCA